MKDGIFNVNELVKIEPPARPVILKSGGDVMNLVRIEGDYAIVEWSNEGLIEHVKLPIACLYICTTADKAAPQQKTARLMNEHMVGKTAEGEVRIVNPPRGPISQSQAVNLAIWLGALVDVAPEAIAEAIKQVREQIS